MRFLSVPAVLFCSFPLLAQLSPLQKQLNVDSFETVWSTIRDKHWQTNPGGLDWQAVHTEFRPLIEQASTMDQARSVLRQMLGRLHQTHFAIVAPGLYQDAANSGPGSPGFEVRNLNGSVIVTQVDLGSSAARAGVKPGWEVVAAGSEKMRPLVTKLAADISLHDLQRERILAGFTTGPIGETRKFTFAAEKSEPIELSLRLEAPRGEMAGFGNLAPVPVVFEFKRLGSTQQIGYIRFNWFLNLEHVMAQFGDAVKACANCQGVIIDLRGNPGGVGAMAMGMAGWFEPPHAEAQQPEGASGEEPAPLRLGIMQMRGATLNFVINPRPGAFTGPLAILVDGSSASTSEIFAGGLQDLGRARIFGTKTAAAALPSIVTRLPNGDGFQYAVANYISEGGKALEGEGVTPDVEVRLTRKALLSGHDSVIDAASSWIQTQKHARKVRK